MGRAGSPSHVPRGRTATRAGSSFLCARHASATSGGLLDGLDLPARRSSGQRRNFASRRLSAAYLGRLKDAGAPPPTLLQVAARTRAGGGGRVPCPIVFHLHVADGAPAKRQVGQRPGHDQ